jgi:hypothetical protein
MFVTPFEECVMSHPTLRLLGIVTALTLAACSPAKMHAHGNAPRPTTYSLQDSGEWKRSPHVRAFYDATVATFANGTDIDVDAYEAKCFAIFREFAHAQGVDEQKMLDHVKLIPRQMVSIVKENPAVLKDYDSFWAALVGPE